MRTDAAGTEQHTQHQRALSADKSKAADHFLTPGIEGTRAQRPQLQHRRRANPLAPEMLPGAAAAAANPGGTQHSYNKGTARIAPWSTALQTQAPPFTYLASQKAKRSSKMLLWRKVGEVGPQRFDTLSTYY